MHEEITNGQYLSFQLSQATVSTYVTQNHRSGQPTAYCQKSRTCKSFVLYMNKKFCSYTGQNIYFVHIQDCFVLYMKSLTPVFDCYAIVNCQNNHSN